MRDTERLQEPGEHFLSWEMEQGKPVLRVTSIKGRRELKINMKSEVRELEVSLRSPEPPCFQRTVDGR